MNINIDTPAYSARAYNAANFTATGGSVTPSSDEYVDRYKVINKTLFWEFNLICDFVSTPTDIKIKLPNSYSTKSIKAGTGVYVSGVDNVYFSTQNDTFLYIGCNAGSFADISTQISFSLTIEIQ